MELLEYSRKEALEQVVAFLQYQRFNYERLPQAERKGHIWEAVEVLERDLYTRQQERNPTQQVIRPERTVDPKPVLESIRDKQMRATIRKVDGPVQGY